MRRSFNIAKDPAAPDWWQVTANDIDGFMLRFHHQDFNHTKRLFVADELSLSDDAIQTILRQMIRWLMDNYYDLLCDVQLPSHDQLLPRQYAMAMEFSGFDVDTLSAAIPCKSTRIKHILEGRYNTINLEMFLHSLEVMGYDFCIYPKQK